MASSVEYLYTAKLGMTTISTANPNLNGTGALGSVITGSSNGTYIKSLFIKAQTDTAHGMLRFFVLRPSGSISLLFETTIPATRRSGRDLSYSNIIHLNYTLESGETLQVSTERANTFNIIAEAFDISLSTTTTFIGNSVEYIARSGSGTINTANPNLDGTGALREVYTGASSSFNGSLISSLTIKAQQTVNSGIVRLFFSGMTGSPPVLFYELFIPPKVQNATSQSFSFQILAQGGLCIPTGSSILASTERADTFDLVAEGSDWRNV